MADRGSQADHEEEEEQGQDKDTNAAYEQGDTVAVEGSPYLDFVEDQQHPVQPEQESECPGCQSLGTLTLPCGHKLCPKCIELSQGELGQAGCTICYGSQLMDSVLQTLLEALFHDQPRRPGITTGAVEDVRASNDGGKAAGRYGGTASEELCLEHQEILSVFCLEEGEPVCQQCQADQHEEHQCCSIQEAVLDCKVRHKNQDTNCSSIVRLGCANIY